MCMTVIEGHRQGRAARAQSRGGSSILILRYPSDPTLSPRALGSLEPQLAHRPTRDCVLLARTRPGVQPHQSARKRRDRRHGGQAQRLVAWANPGVGLGSERLSSSPRRVAFFALKRSRCTPCSATGWRGEICCKAETVSDPSAISSASAQY